MLIHTLRWISKGGSCSAPQSFRLPVISVGSAFSRLPEEWGRAKILTKKNHMKNCKIRAVKNPNKNEVSSVRRVYGAIYPACGEDSPGWTSPRELRSGG